MWVCDPIFRMYTKMSKIDAYLIFRLEKGRVGNNDIVKRKIRHKAGYLEQKWTQHHAA